MRLQTKKQRVMLSVNIISLFLLTLIIQSPLAIAEVIYDNTTTNLNVTIGGGYPPEIGDEINLAGTGRVVTDFMFKEVHLINEPNPDLTTQVRFYANDGVDNSPGTMLYDSGLMSGIVNSLSGLSVTVPNTFTWTVVVAGLADNDGFGLVYYNPPTVGSSGDWYWWHTSTEWRKMDYSDVDNFGARVTAQDISVPEPTSLLLLCLGIAGLAGIRKKMK
jgi:hypothetical protein